jgi:hypothetical protein
LVTNRVDWDAQRIITLYLQRWPIETFSPVLPIHAAFRRCKSFLWKLRGFFR